MHGSLLDYSIEKEREHVQSRMRTNAQSCRSQNKRKKKKRRKEKRKNNNKRKMRKGLSRVTAFTYL